MCLEIQHVPLALVLTAQVWTNSREGTEHDVVLRLGWISELLLQIPAVRRKELNLINLHCNKSLLFPKR